MEIKLISEDPELYKLCTDTLAEIKGDEPWSLSLASPDEIGTSADLCVWDFQPEVLQADCISLSSSQLVVLVHRRDLEALKKRVGLEVCVILKPVTRATLSAFLNLALARQVAVSLRDERDEILQHLMDANLKLQEYDQDRTNFLARVVHDFQSPLTALIGYTGLLLAEPLGAINEFQKEILQRMRHSAARLSRMSSAMVQLSAGCHLKRRPDLRRGDLQQHLDQALLESQIIAEGKEIAVTCKLEPNDMGLYFDPLQIDQVFANLLDNAYKFTPRRGSITIRGYPFFWERRNRQTNISLSERRQQVTQDPNSYRLDIRDSGSVLAQEHLESIFEEYTSYPRGQDRSGAGLGLAICRMIVDQHGGRIWAENTNGGPMFSLVLPIRPLGSARVPAAIPTA